MNILEIVERFKALEVEREDIYQTSGIIGHNYEGAYQVGEAHMEKIAPIASWTLNNPRASKEYPYQHEVIVEGIRFFVVVDPPLIIGEVSHV